jgi:hypothetical protein
MLELQIISIFSKLKKFKENDNSLPETAYRETQYWLKSKYEKYLIL